MGPGDIRRANPKEPEPRVGAERPSEVRARPGEPEATGVDEPAVPTLTGVDEPAVPSPEPDRELD